MDNAGADLSQEMHQTTDGWSDELSSESFEEEGCDSLSLHDDVLKTGTTSYSTESRGQMGVDESDKSKVRSSIEISIHKKSVCEDDDCSPTAGDFEGRANTNIV